VRTLEIPEVDGFSAFETDLSIAASTREAEDITRFQEYLQVHGRGHEQLISLSSQHAVTENYHGPVFWMANDGPYTSDSLFDGRLDVKAELKSYRELEQVLGHTEDWKAIKTVLSINEKLEAYDLSFDEYCNAAEAAQTSVKTKRRL